MSIKRHCRFCGCRMDGHHQKPGNHEACDTHRWCNTERGMAAIAKSAQEERAR